MPDIKEVYEMVVKQSPPQPDALERQQKRQDAVRRNRRMGAVAAVIVIAAALALVFAVTRPTDDTGQPAHTGNESPSTTSRGAQIIGLDGVPIHQFPGSFVDAYGLQRSPVSTALAYSRGSTGNESAGIATVIVATDGSAERLVGRSVDAGDGHAGASWSPDGSQIAYSWNGDIYVMNANGTGQRRLTNVAAGQGNYRPVWSPNGDLIVYWSGSDAGGDGGEPNGEIYTIAADGGGTPMRLTNDHVTDYEPTWSPTGADIAYMHDGELWIMGADGAGKHRAASPVGGAWAPAWSPDGTKIAFLSFSGNRAADGRPVMDVNVLTLSTGDVQATGARVLTDGNGPQWVSDSALLINRYD